MSGYLRQGLPNTPQLYQFVTERESASVMRAVDPFQVDDLCPFNATGHAFAGSCGDVVCVHCARVAWR